MSSLNSIIPPSFNKRWLNQSLSMHVKRIRKNGYPKLLSNRNVLHDKIALDFCVKTNQHTFPLDMALDSLCRWGNNYPGDKVQHLLCCSPQVCWCWNLIYRSSQQHIYRTRWSLWGGGNTCQTHTVCTLN